MINLKIDNLDIETKPRIAIIEACQLIGVKLPRFCYHELLSISGNCRMCLVEIDTIEKPIASCATEAKHGMEIFVENAFVKKARENSLELLLINHPLDCPICDQAGECDLQDQAKAYGTTQSRYFYPKKTTEDKFINPLIKTIMTRCITCTRCVRFASEIAGIDTLGTLGRGRETEINTFAKQLFKSEISGNIVDLCPVGALTNSAYAFKARPWELRISESVDITDSFCSKIYTNSKENKIYRILPKSEQNIKESLISDLTRYSFEYVHNDRLKNILHYSNTTDQLEKTRTLSEGFVFMDNYFKKKRKKKKVTIFIDNKCDLETAYILNQIRFFKKGVLKIVNLDKNKKSNYFKSINNLQSFDFIKNAKEFCCTIATDTKTENPILNLKLRFKNQILDQKILHFGFNAKSNVSRNVLTLNIFNIFELFNGKIKNFSIDLIKKKKSLIILGETLAKRMSSVNNLFNSIKKIAKFSEVLLLYTKVNGEGLNLFNFDSFNRKNMKNELHVHLNTEENNIVRKIMKCSKKTILLQSNGSELLSLADFVFPIQSSFEKQYHYLCNIHTPQKTEVIIKNLDTHIMSPKDILVTLFDRKSQIKGNLKNTFLNYIYEDHHNISIENNEYNWVINQQRKSYDELSYVSTYPIKPEIQNYYNSNIFAKKSKPLIEASKIYLTEYKNF